MSVMKTSLTIIPMCPRERFSHIRTCPDLSLLQKGLGHLVAPYLLSLPVTCYKLCYHKTIYYLQFQCLQRIPYWKPLVISFCSSMGSTLLLIERTTIDPLHLWVIIVLWCGRVRVCLGLPCVLCVLSVFSFCKSCISHLFPLVSTLGCLSGTTAAAEWYYRPADTVLPWSGTAGRVVLQICTKAVLPRLVQYYRLGLVVWDMYQAGGVTTPW